MAGNGSLAPEIAESIVEQLRFGVPPAGRIVDFTVGRDEQLGELRKSLGKPSGRGGAALLVRANYGAGKSHLLKVIREIALSEGYAVSYIEVKSQEGVRFNRMDTIFGAVCDHIEVPAKSGSGIGQLFDAFVSAKPASLSPSAKEIRDRISNARKWDYSDFLSSPALYVALRAWVYADEAGRQLITDWLAHPHNYRGQRKLLYQQLVERLRTKFHDTRAEWQFYSEDVFLFHTSGHRQSWDALADLNTIAKGSGFKGLVLLFDEFEDVIQNLNRRDLQEAAFLNLFRFFSGDRFPGMAYFAVTPDFVSKCKSELLNRGAYGFDYTRFDGLPFFELDPIDLEDFLVLASKIRDVHGRAYQWPAGKRLNDERLRELAQQVWVAGSPERVRRAIKGIVDALDDTLDR
jgi:hypothetical protein